jgi:hypothetical protein
MVGISAIIVWILNNAGGKQEQINSWFVILFN